MPNCLDYSQTPIEAVPYCHRVISRMYPNDLDEDTEEYALDSGIGCMLSDLALYNALESGVPVALRLSISSNRTRERQLMLDIFY